jgi:hypothetical protein
MRDTLFIDLTETEFDYMTDGFYEVEVPPECKLGDELVFRINERPIARAVISRIEKFEGYRVFWQTNTFEPIPPRLSP